VKPHVHARRFLAIAACLLLALGFLSGCKAVAEKVPAKVERPVPVNVAPAVVDSVPEEIMAVGNVEPMASVEVRSQVGGMIVEQKVRDGQDVNRGDLLFRIDSRPFELAVKEAQAKLDRDRALLVKANSDLNRYSELKKKDMVPQEQYDETFSQAKSLDGTIALNEAALEKAKLDLEYAAIRASISGRVGAVLLDQGNVIKANDAILCLINQIEPIFVSFSVPERYLTRIMALQGEGSMAVAIQTTDDEEPVIGLLASMDNAVDTQTGTIRLRAEYANADRRLWPGQFVRVSLRLRTLENVVLAPTRAVMDGLNGPYVYVATPEGIAENRNVEVGPTIQGRTVIRKGVTPGELLVVDGQVRLAPGLKVEVKNAGGDASAPAPEAGTAGGRS